MHLLLSRHGIWYYRKTYLLSSGKRKEIRKSLRTRDKREAKQLAIKILLLSECPDSARKVTSQLITQEQLPSLSVCISNYIDANKHLWQERHQHRIEGVLSEIPSLILTKANVSTLKKKWLEGKSIATVNKCIGYCSMFYKWVESEYDGIENPFNGLKIKGHIENSRTAYTKDELHTFYTQALKLRDRGQESHFWFLMIGRYTGMRANEVCQLLTKDIDQGSNIFFVRGDMLKTKNSKRLIPVHPTLIELGLYGFINSRENRLMEHWKASKRSYAAMPTKWYSSFRKRHNLPDYHSLRHTVGNELKSSGVPVQYCAAILGHANGSITFDRYGHEVAIQRLQEVVKFIGGTEKIKQSEL
ncbi:tyrosine-type recombinase/integrase [Pseudoalteromonas rhizosphaerae]|uniref:tyrosine-type recombinase/integrase n=1 Tax=Pseudoalteromonas rhizosphaerae TaxID=2518973 RepID=UPI00237F5121|nr:tyrosine-type recombinase/integrase [Pseudoalteromonas rhizosphaerae]